MAHVVWTCSVLLSALMPHVALVSASIPGLNTRQEQKFLVMLVILAVLGAVWLIWRERRKRVGRAT